MSWKDEGTYLHFPYKIGFNAELQGYLAYVGIAKSKITKKDDLKILEKTLSCHGGVTYLSTNYENDSRFSKEEFENYYWLGWDYLHADDYGDNIERIYDSAMIRRFPLPRTMESIRDDIFEVIKFLVITYDE